MTHVLSKNIIFLLFFASFVYASTITPADSDTLKNSRNFNEARLDSIRALPAYDYNSTHFSPVDIVDMILAWLWFNLFKHIFNPQLETFWQIVIYLLALVALIYIIRRFMKSEASALFYKNEKKGFDITGVTEDDIHTVPLNELLQQSLSEKKYREAIRLHYLILLKNLADNHLINWQPGKTNHQYQAELENERIKNQFGHLTRLYEYIWYGDFKVSTAEFETIRQNFSDFKFVTGPAR
jgi:hypothetical protein